MTPIQPTPHQQAALDQIQAVLSPRQPTLLCGYAGTGKTTLAHWLAGELSHPLFLAPTNRAAWVLRSKLPEGARVQTIHSAAMQPMGSSHGDDMQFLEGLVRCDGDPDKIVKFCEGLASKLLQAVEARHKPWLLDLLPNAGDETLNPHWYAEQVVRRLRQAERDNVVRFQGRDSEPENVGVVIVDEASMVSTDLAEHISNAFPGVPILFIGDPAQLPPILDNSEKERGVQPLLASTEPTAILTEVLRQAQDSRILRFATHLRSLPTKAPASTWQWAGKVDGEDLTIIPRPRSGCTKGLLKQFDEIIGNDRGVVLTRRNDSRRKINRDLRAMRGYNDEQREFPDIFLPKAGERLIVSQAPSAGALDEGKALDPITGEQPESGSPLSQLTKGEMVWVIEDGELVADGQGYDWVRLEISGGDWRETIHVPAGLFLKTYNSHEGTQYAFPTRNWFQLDYGLCVTVHKAQGSEFEQVAIYEQAAPHVEDDHGRWRRPSSIEHKQWLYTACTRARQRLLLVAMPPGNRKGG